MDSRSTTGLKGEIFTWRLQVGELCYLGWSNHSLENGRYGYRYPLSWPVFTHTTYTDEQLYSLTSISGIYSTRSKPSKCSFHIHYIYNYYSHYLHVFPFSRIIGGRSGLYYGHLFLISEFEFSPKQSSGTIFKPLNKYIAWCVITTYFIFTEDVHLVSVEHVKWYTINNMSNYDGDINNPGNIIRFSPHMHPPPEIVFAAILPTL